MDRERFLFSSLLFLILVGFVFPLQFTKEEKLSFYSYTPREEVKFKQELYCDEEAFKGIKIVYPGAEGREVPALLVLPKEGTPPYPLILYYHRAREEAKTAAISLFKVFPDFAILAIEAPSFKERRKKEGVGRLLTRQGRALIIKNWVLDGRYALDLLPTFPEVDRARVVVMGGSMGVAPACILASVDERIKGAVLISGGALMPVRSRRLFFSKRRDEKLIKLTAPEEFIGLISPRPLLMINGRKDLIFRKNRVEELYNRANEPKRIVWLDRGHNFPLAEVRDTILTWLSEMELVKH
ncbi:MAG: acetylxylan esterase [Acidobacteria bacterium]|nr:acetylxylan esterase [Acidobacteriota bacterium]